MNSIEKAVNGCRIYGAVKIAKRWTVETSNIKNYRITNKRNRQMRELARELATGRGYIIATVKEMRDQFGELSHYEPNAADSTRYIWGICWNNFNKQIEFVSIR